MISVDNMTHIEARDTWRLKLQAVKPIIEEPVEVQEESTQEQDSEEEH